jgi:hypothetical protein
VRLERDTKYSKMLTRHLYEQEEVCSALVTALRYRRTKEAVFWARELILSHEDAILEQTMVGAWLLLLGAPYVHWLDAWFSVKTDLGGCQRLVLVAEMGRLAAEKKPKASGPLKCFYAAARGPGPASTEAVAAAIAENDLFRLCWHLGPLKPAELIESLCGFVDSPEIFNTFKQLVAGRGLTPPIKTLLSVAAVQVLCLDEIPDVLEPEMSADVATWLAEWEPLLGRRGGRVYSIELPLIGESELLGSAVEVMGRGCAFWQSELALIVGDETLETVVDRQFPDDIPDEWSFTERSKSHCRIAPSVSKRAREDMNQKMVELFGFAPVLRKSWLPRLRVFIKALPRT